MTTFTEQTTTQRPAPRRNGSPINMRGAAAAVCTFVALLAMLLWPDLRPWTGIVLTVTTLWWLKEADAAWTRRARQAQQRG